MTATIARRNARGPQTVLGTLQSVIAENGQLLEAVKRLSRRVWWHATSMPTIFLSCYLEVAPAREDDKMRTKFQFLFFIGAVLMSFVSTHAAPAKKVVYYQNYAKSSLSPGFKLSDEISANNAKPGQYFWRATYDEHDRIVLLETIVPPMCVESKTKFVYDGTTTHIAEKVRSSVNVCAVIEKESKVQADLTHGRWTP